MDELKNVLESAQATVMYPCAGDDFKPLVFTSKEFLEYRTNYEIMFKDPDYFVYIDNNFKFYEKNLDSEFLYKDASTEIKLLNISSLKSPFKNSSVYQVELVSKNKPDWMTTIPTPRIKNIIYIDADWRAFAEYRFYNRIPAYIGIGVTDGCRFGGNKECVNKLISSPFMQSINDEDLTNFYSTYWITDHFTHNMPYETLYNGEYVISRDRDFPVRFKKLALLSSSWGNYGYPPSLRGATLFRIEPSSRS